MGVAITSGVLASLNQQSHLHRLMSGHPKWESHTPGTSTPTNVTESDPTLPSRFIACVKREESAKRLRVTFRSLVGGEAIQITTGPNVAAVQQSDVVLLWCVAIGEECTHFGLIAAVFFVLFFLVDGRALPVANHRWRISFSTRTGSKKLSLGSCSSASSLVSP